jgi:uncharacterized membrane protein YccC
MPQSLKDRSARRRRKPLMSLLASKSGAAAARTVAALRGSARRLALWFAQRGPEARLAVRVTVAGLVAFAIGRALGLAQGYWAVFTAIIVMQASLGGSFGAALDYFYGTLAGAIYGVAIATAIPIHNVWELGLALALALLPLAFIAALWRHFRAAPITAVIVLIIPALQHSGTVESAIGRVEEIAVGSAVGIVVSRFVLPARAHGIVAETAADMLRLAARMIPRIFGGFAAPRDLGGIVKLQDGYRRLLVKLDGVVAEAARERSNHLSAEPDAEPILRTLRRLRFDFTVLGRAAGAVLPPAVAPSLLPPLGRAAEALERHLDAAAAALRARRPPPAHDAVDEAFAGYAAAIGAVRRAGLTRGLSDGDAQRIFTIGFALDQLRRNLGDLHERIAGFARKK